MEINFTPKNAIYACNYCNFKCFKKSDWNRHIKTIKHISITSRKENGNLETLNTPKNAKNKCICGKTYSTNSGLWKHKNKCETKNESNKEECMKDMGINDLVTYLIKENSELRKEIKTIVSEQQSMMLKVIENGTHNTTNNNNNCNNKTFNLNMFLNEKCKDALNINEFIDSLKITFSDLENIGENGFINGISKIFVNGLKSLDIYKRPIHCSDLKRETMYLKEQNVWEKDNENNDRLKKAVKLIAHKNMLKINDWKQANPQCKDSDSKKNDQYLKILISTAGPTNKEDEIAHYEKIIKNIAKEVTIDKEM